jgi:hypothetical protein
MGCAKVEKMIGKIANKNTIGNGIWNRGEGVKGMNEGTGVVPSGKTTMKTIGDASSSGMKEGRDDQYL